VAVLLSNCEDSHSQRDGVMCGRHSTLPNFSSMSSAAARSWTRCSQRYGDVGAMMLWCCAISHGCAMLFGTPPSHTAE